MKKIISIILTIAMLAASVSAFAVNYGEEYTNKPTKTYTQKFDDVPSSHWAFAYIGEMSDREVVSGYPNGKFYPNNEVTRAEFARIMTSASGLQISAPTSKDFNDVETDAWYAPYVHAAYPYLSGYNRNGGSYYMPDTPALREDIAVALVKLKGYDTLGADESLLKTMFTDVDSISSDARKYVAVAVERGLVSGYEDDTFRGQDSITRAEATAILWRAYQYGNDNKSFDVEVSTPEPTATPEAKTTPKPTTEPTVTPIAEPTTIPTSKPTETLKPEAKPKYEIDTVDKLASSNVYITTFNDKLYYASNNVIYCADRKTPEEYFDISELTQDDLSNFQITSLYGDDERGILMLSGFFSEQDNPGGLSNTSVRIFRTFDISDINSPSLLYENGYRDISAAWDKYIVANDKIIIPESGEVVTEFEGMILTHGSHTIFEKDGELYAVWVNIFDDVYLLKYNASKGQFNTVRNIWRELQPLGKAASDKYFEVYNGEAYYWLSTNYVVKTDINGNMTWFDENLKEESNALDFKAIPDTNDKRMYITSKGAYFVDSSDYKNNYLRFIYKAE